MKRLALWRFRWRVDEPGGAYAEAQLAGWVPTPMGLQPEQLRPALASGSHAPDAEALLARFYSAQEC